MWGRFMDVAYVNVSAVTELQAKARELFEITVRCRPLLLSPELAHFLKTCCGKGARGAL